MARRIRGAAANGNVYFTSSRGLLKSTSAAANYSGAGMPRCLDLVLALNATSATLLTDTGTAPTAGADQARAYRGVWCQRDANNNLVQGVPSSRAYIVNSAGATRNVDVAVALPSEIGTTHFFQLYASAIVDNGTVVDPGDELRLVMEYFPTAADVTAGTFTITDNVPDSFRKDDLYTNAEQLTIARQFDRPPLCRDVVWFNNKLVVANLTDPNRMDLQLLGTTGMVTQTITIAGVVYTAGTTEVTATGTFQVFKSGGGGYTDKGLQALNVDFTARSLCNVINKYAANTLVYAFYVPAGADVPGKIQIEERGVGGSSFAITTSASTMGILFSPALPTSGTTYSSVADRRVNWLRISEDGQPEHMSRARNIIVGGADEEIQRVIALRSSLIIIKDRSIWRITEADVGETPVLLDNTAGIRGRDTAAALNNAVYMLSDQGFVCVTENGMQIVGRPIENKVLASNAEVDADYANTYYVGQGVERDRYYICGIYDVGGNEKTCFRYSPISNGGRGAWSRRRIFPNAMCVTDSRLLYAVPTATPLATGGNIMRQRKSRPDPWYRDYCEDETIGTVTAVDPVLNTVTIQITRYVYFNVYNSYIPTLGWKYYDSNSFAARTRRVISGVAAGSSGGFPIVTITLDSVDGISVSNLPRLFRPVSWKVEWTPIGAGNPLELKSFDEVLAKLETCMAYAIDAEFINQADTKPDPAADSWTALPAAVRVYVPLASGAEPSATSNDFNIAQVGASNFASETVNPNNEIRTLTDPTRAQGQHLAVRLSGAMAEGFVAIKALVVTLASTGSKRTRQ